VLLGDRQAARLDRLALVAEEAGAVHDLLDLGARCRRQRRRRRPATEQLGRHPVDRAVGALRTEDVATSSCQALRWSSSASAVRDRLAQAKEQLAVVGGDDLRRCRCSLCFAAFLVLVTGCALARFLAATRTG